MIELVAEKLNVGLKELRLFECKDPYNPENLVRGYICSRSDYRYGCTYITHINEEETEQIIWATPKLEYPFNRNGIFIWPKSILELQIYEKLDGTNILAYTYTHRGKGYITYKTRLTPFVSNLKFGPFASMWIELLDTKPWIKEAINNNPSFNLSFELYGMRNPITVTYNTPLDTKILFGINKKNHLIKPPTELNIFKENYPENYTYSKDDFTKIYHDLKIEAEEKNKDNLLTEGFVFYAFVKATGWRMFKCKPSQIEKIHWGNDSIPRNSIWNTCLNCYESFDEPTIEDVITLLKEEYTDNQIYKCEYRINKLFFEAKIHMEFTNKVNTCLEKARKDGADFKSKNDLMRHISKYFDKKDMGKVGTIVLSIIQF